MVVDISVVTALSTRLELSIRYNDNILTLSLLTTAKSERFKRH
ncbi:MAG: hypothetical protein FKGGLIKP_00448 [Sodalis sp. Fse]|nr:MAG: hypothetical protein FKGGLIKP_00448 [Sodalis sp. Fse]